ncbi:hypothetical protein B0G62_12034 [Paraburkholderia eburnea]|uniref:Uncharacterized protein n=1 Tax=Paraburkholderia eburnea TaxID=1189126 RepID=A0A2S4LX58_9BURK|nr:hypothetical protein [Paraburkholderia eburnea]POR47041.1 hypothetical protein B0G62_12034 [Paraburkholderia eburnea]PRZ18271.1 hypothetical protein BX588_12034 [Paraburkholderia eburnea]
MIGQFPRAARTSDFWRVNSYGYPCFFSESEKSQEAWTTLLSFFNFTNYDELKSYWSSTGAPRQLSSHAVESWKATFEEFGILYVESRSNRITITPAGAQLKDAADRGDKNEFAWIGLNLLLRYPLRGPRRPKSEAHRDSDLLLYRFWYSALLDLDGYVWWTELERVLCRVFLTNETIDAVEDIRTLRSHPELLTQINMPVGQRQGAFYNSLNQVAVHAGMNHLLLGGEDMECPYGVTELKRRHFIRKDWLGMIRKALSNNGGSDQCATGGSAIARLPAAPMFSDENEYFSYLGAPVTPMNVHVTSALTSVVMQGERVFFLSEGESYKVLSGQDILGPVASLCQLARGQRIILSHDEQWTYLVEAKDLLDANVVKVRLRRARPISNIQVIRALRGNANG